jgi:3-deoxy-D-manno-octulosonic-acid transferase
MLRAALLALRQTHPETKLIIVPRHPKRATEIERLFRNDTLRTLLFSQRSRVQADVIVVDCIGLLGSLYAVADVTFVGGSLVRKGGQNPIEPAAAGKPVLFGPDMSDFPEVSRLLLEKGGAIRVQNTGDLIEQCGRLLADPSLAATVGMRARAVVEEHQGASRKIAADIVAFLDKFSLEATT